MAHLCCFACAGPNGGSAGPVALSPSGDPVLTPIDGAVDPCVNFAEYACGTGKQPLGFLQKISGVMVWDRAPAVRNFLDRLVSGPYRNGKGRNVILGEFYGRCIDAKARELGLRELRGQLEEIDRIDTFSDLARMLGLLHRRGIVRALLRTDLGWEAVAPEERYVARIALVGPKLPQKAYANGNPLPAEHVKHWQALARLVGGIAPPEIERARRVDRWLASASEAGTSKSTTAPEPLVSAAHLEKVAFPWRAYLSGLGLAIAASVQPERPDTLNHIDALAKLPLADLRSNVKLSIVERWAEFVGVPVFEEEIRFHQEVVNENEHQDFELRQACTDLTSRALNPWLDEAFLAGLPTPHERPAQEMFQLLRERFAQTVAATAWLDDRTRAAAAAKVRRIALRFVADPIPGLDDVVFPAGSFLDVELRTSAQMSERYLAQIGSTVERKLHVTQDEGAMYSSLVNSVWLSPEFARFPWIQGRPFNSINFGSLGTLLGHEIAHALTITGRRFDDVGMKRETWPQTAVSAFESRTACLEKRLGTFDAGAKWKVDANQTLDEDIAEVVGLQVALAAMDADAGPASAQIRDSRRQDFFLAYAQQGCGFNRGRAYEDQVDATHSPLGRALSAILANVPEFAETFRCAPGTRMAPRDRCAIW